MTKEGTPAVLFRNSIDLNRFSNGVSRKIVQSNIDVIIRAAKQLSKIDPSRPPSYKTARLRSLIKQTKESLSTWEKESVDVMIRELEGLAGVQAGFVEDQIAQALPNGVLKTDLNPLGYSVQTVAVSPSFAKAVVTKDPSVLSLKSTGTFDLTAAQGAEVLLPNGETVQKAFRGLASRQATQFNQVVRTGLLSGETTESIVSQLIGNLQFGQGAKTNQQYLLAGKEVLNMASHQIRTVVRTSINQVSNAASQQVYKANEDITEKYKYVSTLDSRTTALCASLDGKEFEYGKGPEPPQHFNCRSTTVAVIDYDALKKMGWDFDVPKEGRRAAAGGMVPANETYGKWLYGQRKAGTKFTPGARQIEALGKEKARYFNRLANKYGADNAIKKFVREDGSEVSLFQLKKRYGKPESITVKKKTAPKKKIVSKPKVKTTAEELKETKAQLAALKERDPSLPTIAQLQGVSPTGKVTANEVNKAFDLMDQMEGVAGENARKLRKFAEKKQVFCNWSNAREGTLRSGKQKYEYFLDNPQFKKTIQTSLKNETTYGFSDVYRDMDTALKTNNFKFVSYEAKRYFTAGGKGRKYMNGMTIKGANHIVLKATSKQKAIKNLKKMQDDVRDAVKYAKNNQNNPNWDRNNYWSAHGKGRFDEGTSWLKTYVHEMGHQIHYTNEVNKLSSYDWIPSAYGNSDYKERFAETFVQFIFSPVELKKASPSAYKWIEDTIDASLKKVDKWT
tara:strand:- start:1621 stop:3822 length:2202 start_codon:yes stop_codon:yes gene_type:complete